MFMHEIRTKGLITNYREGSSEVLPTPKAGRGGSFSHAEAGNKLFSPFESGSLEGWDLRSCIPPSLVPPCGGPGWGLLMELPDDE